MCIPKHVDKGYDAQFTSQDPKLSYSVRLCLPFQQYSISKLYNTNLKHDDWMLL